jgi:hypothetical protein
MYAAYLVTNDLSCDICSVLWAYSLIRHVFNGCRLIEALKTEKEKGQVNLLL